MKTDPLKSTLADLAEKAAPSTEINLWPGIKSELSTSAWHSKNGETMKTPAQNTLIRRLSLATLALATAFALLAFTPHGRTFAQSVIQLFTRAQSESFQTGGPIAEPDASMSTAMPPSPVISIADAKALADFNLLELPFVPQGFEYLGTRMYEDAVSTEYGVPGGGGNLVLMQSKEGFIQSEWDQVPANAIVPVKVGDVDAEYAQGTFVVIAGETSAKWNSDAPVFRLRWVRDGIWFELTKYGDVFPIEYLDMDGLIALAESLK
jgi:hypothetical protein